MADIDVTVRGWTRHGHRIKGMVQVDPRPPVARCGGPGICTPCSVDAARAERGGQYAAPQSPDGIEP